MSIKKSLSGQQIGRITVGEGFRCKPEGCIQERTYYRCRCSCGKEYTASHTTLSTSKNRIASVCEASCGCAQHEWVAGLQALAAGESDYNYIEHYYIENAKRANLLWGLTREEFRSFLSKPCNYCGISNSMERITKIGKNSFKYNGIDRVDSSLDYTLDNCVTACKWCNWAKREVSVDTFLLHVRRIKEFVSKEAS